MNQIMLSAMVRIVLDSANIDMKCPVTINNRLKRTLGRAMYKRTGTLNHGFRIEFSGDFVRRATPECIKAVVLHECAHIICAVRDMKTVHGHDSYFRAVCLEIGTDNYRSSMKVEYIR